MLWQIVHDLAKTHPVQAVLLDISGHFYRIADNLFIPDAVPARYWRRPFTELLLRLFSYFLP
jgi:hypothetical protein